MPSRRQFVAATALLGAAGNPQLISSVLAQAQAPQPPEPQAAGPRPPEQPPGVGGSRGSPPGPWSVPAEHPDPNRWQGFKPTPARPIVHADFVLSPSADPLQLFVDWFNAARAAGETNTEAMTLSTVDSSGMPDSRMMLLHWINEGRFQFSSYETSAKGKQLKANPKASLLFFWKKTGQVVRVRGTVQKFTRAQTDDLRPLKRGGMDARLHDLVFKQSEVIQGTEELEQGIREAQNQYKDDVPPRDWVGYFLTPLAIEFFLPMSATVNVERLRFSRKRVSASWVAERLAP